MNKIIPIALTLGCIGAGAATSNYDLLGRKGSQMNSPMVYRNVDYSKVKKDEQQKVGPSLEAHSLQKMGMPDDIKAIEGAYISRFGQTRPFFFKKHKAYSSENCFSNNANFCQYSWNDYKKLSNQYFIPIKEDRYYTLNYDVTADWSYISGFSKQPAAYGNYTLPSPYSSGQTIQYEDFYDVLWEDNYLRANRITNWFSDRSSDVGLYMGTEALPAMYAYRIPVRYKMVNSNESFYRVPDDEVRATKIFSLIPSTSKYSVVYVGKNNPIDPAGQQPQVYMGLRSDKISKTSNYMTSARNLDDFIYQYRTVEIVPAGNYGKSGGQLNSQAHSANAITVGAIDPFSMRVTDYTSTETHSQGSAKPEVCNFSNFYMKDDNHAFYARRYNYNNREYLYQPFYDGTEMAAAFTAGMVSNLLAINPFYRWHPEVVKALLLTSQGTNMTSYPNGSGLTSAPAYDFLVFGTNDGERKFGYDSRYWNGDINKLKTRTVDNKHEIWFVTRNNRPGGLTTAAIAWLSSGKDVARTGKIPQDFDMYIYGSDKDYSCLASPNIDLKNPQQCSARLDFSNPGSLVAYAESPYNAYERRTFRTSYEYLVFKIVLYSDDVNSDNYGQIVLGFNLSGPRIE
ncbi:S8 family serine peptidase [Fibrobacter succinogenes]|uniref:S8 family serine peptidase n=1 Tax=Fibrobacter succinogenes TaxID=833 RepID=UPI0015660686|nr:S8 family serine peptidase [Fibrobacter succinogenes]